MSVEDAGFSNRGADPTQNIPRSKVTPDKPWYDEYAKLSQAAYDPSKHTDTTRKMGYRIDKQLSSRTHTVYRHRSGKVVVAYKGTSPEQWKRIRGNDLAADLGIALGIPEHLNGRFRQADKVYRQAASKYGAKNVEVTGHSLGGSQAIYIGRKYHAKGIAFEPGSGPGDAINRFDEDLRHKVTDMVYKGYKKHMPAASNRTGVHVVASSFSPGKSKEYSPLYGIAGLYHLPGREKRTWVNPRLKNSHDVKNFL